MHLEYISNLLRITSMFGFHMIHKCWTSQRRLSCSLLKSVCCDWTATDGTHNCRPGCENIVTVNGKRVDLCVCGFCWCGVRSWESHVWCRLGLKEHWDLLHRCWVGRAGPIPWPGRSCDLTLLDNVFWDCVTERSYLTKWCSPDIKAHWNWTCFRPAVLWDHTQHKIVISLGYVLG